VFNKRFSSAEAGGTDEDVELGRHLDRSLLPTFHPHRKHPAVPGPATIVTIVAIVGIAAFVAVVVRAGAAVTVTIASEVAVAAAVVEEKAMGK
jgi:hypothetical protein